MQLTRTDIKQKLDKFQLDLYDPNNISILEELYEASLEINYFEGIVLSKLYYANHIGAMGEVEKALTELNDALKSGTAFGLEEITISVMKSIGSIYLLTGNFESAMEQYLKAYDNATKLNIDFPAILLNIGEIYRLFGDYDKATFYFDKIITPAKHSNDLIDYHIASSNLCEIQLDKKEFDKNILDKLLESLQFSIDNNDLIGIGDNNRLIARYYAETGDSEKAIKYFETCIDKLYEIDEGYYIYTAVLDYSKFLIQLNKLEDSLALLKKYLRFAIDKNRTNFTPKLCERITDIYEKLNDNKHALEYYKLYKKYNIVDNDVKKLNRLKGIHSIEVQHKLKDETFKLKHISKIDPLTQLRNRYLMVDEIEENIRNKGYNSIIGIDLDDFKLINDTYGHSVGDKLLVKISEKIKELENEYNMVAYRYGGDEFLLTLRQDNMSVKAFGKILLNNISNISYKTSTNEDISITCSIGIVNIREYDNYKVSRLIHYADQAMYESKQNKNSLTVKFY